MDPLSTSTYGLLVRGMQLALQDSTLRKSVMIDGAPASLLATVPRLTATFLCRLVSASQV